MADNRKNIYDAMYNPSPWEKLLTDLPQQLMQMEKLKMQKSQQEFTNELNIFRMLPEEARPGAYATSKNEKIRQIGEATMEREQSFKDDIYSLDPKVVEAPSAEIERLEAKKAIYAGNPKWIRMIDAQIGSLQKKAAKKSIDDYFEANPNDPRKDAIVARAKVEPLKSLKDIIPSRTSTSTHQKGVYNPKTGEYSFATDAEIAAAKETPTKDDDLIPGYSAPSKSGKGEYSLTQLNKSIESVEGRLYSVNSDIKKAEKDGGVAPKVLLDKKNNIEKRLNHLINERDKFFNFETDNEKPEVIF
jgi:hypothetical protein